MLNEETLSKLTDLKLHSLAAEFRLHLDQTDHDALTYEERFGLMIDSEWTERQERKLKRRLSSAQLREKACFEDIDYKHPRNLDRSVMQRLAACKWIANHENIIFTGPTGVGKTWLACALANQACRLGKTSLFIRVPRLLQNLYIAHADGSYAKLMNKLAKPDMLIIDDLGVNSLSDAERRDLLEVIEDRQGRRSIVVTSQLPVKAWHDTIGDPVIADAILDRLISKSHRIQLKGKSLRPTDPENGNSTEIPATKKKR